MLVVIARAQARPDRADDLAALLAPLAEASRADAGCEAYVFTRDVEDPTRFSSIEQWASRADLDAHMGQPHTQAALARLGDLVAAAPTIHAHEVSATDQLA